MRIEQLREAGPFAIETFMGYRWDCSGRDFPQSVITVYADTYQPSHCVRIWVWEEK